MKPLKVALFVKNSPWALEREKRNMGMWSYPVPEFTWTHFAHSNFAKVDKASFLDYDLIFQEDSGWTTYTGSGAPVVYHTFDSMLSDDHLQVRRRQAEMADLIMVDQDDLQRMRIPGKKTIRFPFAVNDHLFTPLEKTTDVSFHCNGGAKNDTPGALIRSKMRVTLGEISRENGWCYVSGSIAPVDYAASLGKSKVTVNLHRVPHHRAHRVFDAMAACACLLTDKCAPIPEDIIQEGIDYVCYDRNKMPVAELTRLINGGEWKDYAERGHKIIMENHTWEIRAKQLRQLLAQEFGL